MTVAQLKKRNQNIESFYYEEDILSGQPGADVRIPPLRGRPIKISVTLLVPSGSGKVQFTTSPDAKVAAGLAAWQDWEAGEVTQSTSSVIGAAVSGLRGVSISDNITFEIMI